MAPQRARLLEWAAAHENGAVTVLAHPGQSPWCCGQIHARFMGRPVGADTASAADRAVSAMIRAVGGPVTWLDRYLADVSAWEQREYFRLFWA